MGGYRQTLPGVVSEELFKAEGVELVVVRNVEFYSLCEHHLLPFLGRVHIAYLPDKTILGLGKFGHIVDMFARRLQVRERLTTEIADAVIETLQPKGVVAEASYPCMMMQAVHKREARTRTLTTRGVFADTLQLRQEVLEVLKQVKVDVLFDRLLSPRLQKGAAKEMMRSYGDHASRKYTKPFALCHEGDRPARASALSVLF